MVTRCLRTSPTGSPRPAWTRRSSQAVTERLVPRTSALLVLSGAADLSVVVPAVRQRIVSGDVTLLRADLPADGPELLRTAVGLEPLGPTD